MVKLIKELSLLK